MFKKKIDMSQIIPTSRMSLKLSCLAATNNDIERAEKLYEFLSADMMDIPDTDPVRLTGIQRIKQNADEIFGWLNSHQEDLMKGISLIQGLKAKVPQVSVSNVAPIPKI